MGRIRDKHEKNKRKEDDNNPLGELGNRDKNKDFDLDKDNIKDKQDKK